MMAVKDQTEEESEEIVVAKWREEQFFNVLKNHNVSDEDIDLVKLLELVKSKASPHDLDAMIKNGCPVDTAIDILR
jgi:6-phosphogluconate dehydrogenase